MATPRTIAALGAILVSLAGSPAHAAPPAQEAAATLAKATKSQEAGKAARAKKEATLALKQARAAGPRDSELVGDAHHRLGSILEDLRAFDDAQKHLESALRIHRKRLGKAHAKVGLALYGLGRVLKKRGKLKKADTAFADALAIQEKALGPDHEKVIETLNDYADLMVQRTAWKRAEAMYRRMLSSLEKGTDRASLGIARTNFALYLARRGRHRDALGVYQKGLADVEAAQGKNHANVGAVLDAMAASQRRLGLVDEAGRSLKRALSIQRASLGPEHPRTAGTMQGLALLRIRQARYDEAIRLLERAETILEKRLGPKSRMLANTLGALAGAYERKGEPWRAEPLYQRALTIRKARYGDDHPSVATSLNNLGMHWLGRGQVDKAVKALERALDIKKRRLGAEHPRMVTAHGTLASAYSDARRYDDALRHFRLALQLAEKIHGPDHVQVGRALNNVGVSELEAQHYAEAGKLLERALRVRKATLGADHPELASTLFSLAQVAAAQGDRPGAEARFREALATRTAKVGPLDERAARIRRELGSYLMAGGKREEGMRLIAEADRATDDLLTLLLPAASTQAKRAYVAMLQDVTDVTLGAMRAAPGDQTVVKHALGTLLRRKGRTVDAEANVTRALRARAEGDDLKRLDALRDVRSRMAHEALVGGGKGDALTKLREKAASLEAALGRRYQALSLDARVELDAVRKRLGPGDVWIEITVHEPFELVGARLKPKEGGRHYMAFVARRDGPVRSVDLGEAKAIDREVRSFRKTLGAPGTPYGIPADRLAELVVAPLEPLVGDAKRLFVVPDGPLQLVPFGALPGKAGVWLERASVVQLGSAREILPPRKPLPPRQPAVVIANPDFGAGAPPKKAGRSRGPIPSSVRFQPLPGTAAEGAALHELLPGAQLLHGAQATEAAVKALHGPALLHVATHGFFVPPRKVKWRASRGSRGGARKGASLSIDPLLRSGLALAGANPRKSGEEDGILTAMELSALDLQGTELVALSACQTGVGEVARGDGVYGLRRALALAGARTQVISLWNVDDDATRLLMGEFYARLKRGEPKADALRGAQLAVRKNARFNHPHYWASFILSGDPGPLQHLPKKPAAPPPVPPKQGGCACTTGGAPESGGLPLWLAGVAWFVARRRAVSGRACRRDARRGLRP